MEEAAVAEKQTIVGEVEGAMVMIAWVSHPGAVLGIVGGSGTETETSTSDGQDEKRESKRLRDINVAWIHNPV